MLPENGLSNMLSNKIYSLVKSKGITLLGVGPMSLNCIDAAIELSRHSSAPIMLIASRRQIDSEYFGGGYVNSFSTSRFAEYVHGNDKNGNILLARDHGGPWQHPLEIDSNLCPKDAIESAKQSFKADIDAGFQILHIDTSIHIHGVLELESALDRLYELYEYCWGYAQSNGKDIAFEIGTEEQTGSFNSIETVEYILSRVKTFCVKNSIPFPLFTVAQTGTRVLESKNVGSLDSPLRVEHEIPPEIQIPRIVNLCNRYSILLKAHNVDYVSTETLSWFPRLGIDSANVAPEFGVAESETLVSVLEKTSKHRLAEKFLELSFNSGKWKKWISPTSNLTDKQKAILCGHYIFSTSDFKDLKDQMNAELLELDIHLDRLLVNAIYAKMYRFADAFGITSQA